MSDLLHVSSSPHVRSKVDTSSIMLTVFLALMPAALVGIYNFRTKCSFADSDIYCRIRGNRSSL